MKKVNECMYSMGYRIRTARKAAGLTQRKVAELVNVSDQYISDLERGLVGASAETVVRLSLGLGVTTDYILKGE